jgi:osmotically-inducible protein OsmY
MNTGTLSRSDPDRLAPQARTLQSSVERRWQTSGYTALTRIHSDFEGESGILHLRGSLPSHYLKQVAQELVIDLEGVRRVDNQINVIRSVPREPAWNRHRADEPDASPGM